MKNTAALLLTAVFYATFASVAGATRLEKPLVFETRQKTDPMFGGAVAANVNDSMTVFIENDGICHEK